MSSWYNENRSLTEDEKKHNATLFYNYFASLGWSINAICATLGNIEAESGVNPGRWQIGFKPCAKNAGYGLVQWTPWTKYANWAGGSWEGNGDLECNRIEYEWRNEKQWIKNMKMSFKEYATSSDDIEYLTEVFVRNYERPKVVNLQPRIEYALKWYSYLTGDEAPPKPPSREPSKFLGVITYIYLKYNKNNQRRKKYSGRTIL